jgi:hypothetical protein
MLRLISVGVGLAAALCIAEASFRVLGLRAEPPGRVFRISNGADLQFPGRAGHSVIDLYVSNPRGQFPVDLRDDETRARLIRGGFARVDEVRKTNPYGVVSDYNSRGFREREFMPKPVGRKRIVFVGDSFTEAQGVIESASSVRLVEDILKRRDPDIETWNLGVRGQDFPRIEAIFEIAFELDPDALIFEMVLNDADRDPELGKDRPRVNDWIMVRQDTPSWIERHSHLVSFLSDRIERFRVSRDTVDWYQALYSDRNQGGWMRTRAVLARVQAKCRARGIDFGVALWPLLVGLEEGASYPFEAAHAQIRKGVERSGIPFLDLLPALRGRDSASLWVHPSDLHPNEVAQSLAAGSLADFAYVRLQQKTSLEPVAGRVPEIVAPRLTKRLEPIPANTRAAGQ